MQTVKYQLDNTFSDVVSDIQLSLYSTRKKSQDRAGLNVVSLFSGCGGMDLGFEGGFICNKKSLPQDSNYIDKAINEDWVLLKKNKFRTVFANDILKEAMVPWVNYMSRYGIDSDVFHLQSIVELVKMHNNGVQIFPENIDIVTGGFPCQDFSVAGKRKGFESETLHNGTKSKKTIESEESRGKLYYWMKQVIDITKPKMFIAENVKGLANLGDIKNIIQKDFASADNNGYIVLDPQILNAGNYGVPEMRERVIFIGIRKSALNETSRLIFESGIIPSEYNPYPKPTHNYTVHDDTLLSPVTCRDIFSNLKEPDVSDDLSQRFYSKAKYMGRHCQGQNEIDIDGLAPTIRSEHHGNIEFRRLSLEHNGLMIEELNKGLKERRLSPRECALIQTFPPDYSFVSYKQNSHKYQVSPSAAYKVIGNAVPPMLAFNIAVRIQELWTKYFE